MPIPAIRRRSSADTALACLERDDRTFIHLLRTLLRNHPTAIPAIARMVRVNGLGLIDDDRNERASFLTPDTLSTGPRQVTVTGIIAIAQTPVILSGEITAIIGDNGAGKSTLVKAIAGAVTPDHVEIRLNGEVLHFRGPQDAQKAGIKTVYQNLALSPALSIADNMFLGRELRKPGLVGSVFRLMDHRRMQDFARNKLSELGLMTIQNINVAVETLSGGQRQGMAVARAAAFGSRVIILDEPTAALGVKESRKVLELILDVRSRGIPIILISHNMPHVFEVADRLHIHRLGRRLCVINPKNHTMSDAVAYMTGAKVPEQELEPV